MRQVVLDTETTGLELGKGHRLIEIGCVELSERRLTGRIFHHYLNPQREIEAGALAVHGITREFLDDKPLFGEIVREFLEFIEGAELIIHNATFDISFLDNELGLVDKTLGCIRDRARVLDTLVLAREKFPGQKNSLDALCKRLNIDNSHRDMHGALLDAQLLADVFLAMTAGQADLGFSLVRQENRAQHVMARDDIRAALRIRYANELEMTQHEIRLASIEKASKGQCLWRKTIG